MELNEVIKILTNGVGEKPYWRRVGAIHWRKRLDEAFEIIAAGKSHGSGGD